MENHRGNTIADCDNCQKVDCDYFKNLKCHMAPSVQNKCSKTNGREWLTGK